MMSSKKVQLTYIPANYWNAPISGFKINGKANIPKKSDFFVLWHPDSNTVKDLSKRINFLFPGIPTDKLLTCKINMAIPNDDDDGVDGNEEDFFSISPLIAKILPLGPITKILYRLDLTEREESPHSYSRSIMSWAFLTKFIFELMCRGSFIPVLAKEAEKAFIGQWKLLLKTQEDNIRFKTILNNTPFEAHNLPVNLITQNDKNMTNGLWHPSYLLSYYMDALGDYLVRSTLDKSKFEAFKYYYSHQIEEEKNHRRTPWDYRFLKSILTKEDNFSMVNFHDTIVPELIRNWVQIAKGFTYKSEISFKIELLYPDNEDDSWPLRFYIQLDEKEKPIPIKNLWKILKTKKKVILNHFESEEKFLEIILKSLGTASKLFPPIERALNETTPSDIQLESSEVMEFLKYPKELLIQSGFNVILPDAFTRGGKRRLSARLIIKSDSSEKRKIPSGASATLPSMFDINSFLNYQWKVSLEEKDLTKDELENFINSPEPLVKWRDEWVLVDQQDVKELRGILETDAITGKKSYMEALKMGLTGSVQLEENGSKYDVIIEGDLNAIILNLMSIENFKEISTPDTFNGTLRPYQKDALTWMGNMCALNFGLCLADDMGLGKTIQVIAYLLHRKVNYPKDAGSYLVICPTSVLFNWKREISKFAPNLDIMLHHGSDRIKDASGMKELMKPHRIILTSYGTLRNDIDLLETIPFSGIIVDESQNMKNYASQQTQAIYNLQSQFRICLSGTPIENRLIELWSLFNFLNPGLLGERTEFQKNYIIPIERYQQQDAINDLKTLIDPFILRRVKSDKSIISDLPEKNEMELFIDLTPEQVELYKDTVENTLNEIETSENTESMKKGLILKLLTQLKQICNHPYQFKKTMKIGPSISEFTEQSNKVERLIEIVDEIMIKREKILIFTQFRQMGDLLVKVFNKLYEFPVLYFHGGVPEKKRREIVDEFQSPSKESPPILILSLKAGGTGLNLTQGTTVVHFDRWWNPAVEDQATDRAYRIGQKSNVNVYKFITIGTIEEKINALLEEKRELADKIVASSGEGWLSDLSFDKIKDLVSLTN